jgi:isoleucyl-tRNA synthetase
MDDQPQKSSAPDFNQIELDILKFWNENNIFEKTLKQTEGKEPYVFYDGPPFATGLPHYGHILASTIKDAIPRYQTMRGRFVRRRWGWDCHGLPIENIVEQQLKISGKKQIEEIGIDRFNTACRENVLSYADEWGKTVNRIGRFVEFENSYKTMDATYMESVWWALKQIWDKGLIYEDRKVLLYCSRCETPVSNFEVAMDNSYREVTEQSVFVKFKLLPRQRIVDFLTSDKTYVLAWTTTPWTLPGNTALNIGPDITYLLVEQEGNHYIIAKDRVSVLQGPYEIIRELTARSIESLSYEPLYPGVINNESGRAHRIYSEDYVTVTDGTGIVHNAAMYGEDDYEVAKRRDLPREHILDSKGQYGPKVPSQMQGLFFKDADKVVLKDLEERGLIYRIENYTHSYPFCWRCSTPLFYNALSAWFINIQKIKPELTQLNERINWYPGHLKQGRFEKGIETAPDWNISRNRYWATALPFWKCSNNSCKRVVCIGSVEELKLRSSNFLQVYPNYDGKNVTNLDLHKPYIDKVVMRCEACGNDMCRIPEVVDCWVESGSMPFAELHYPFENKELFAQRFPAQFVAEYISQTRAWFYVSHVIATAIFGRAPFENVVTTGIILAEDGSKMSKSKKNYPDPWELINRYGVDPIRLYLLGSPVMLGEDMNFSEKALSDIQRKVILLLYNVWSFLRMYSQGKFTSAPQSSHVLDKWILTRLAYAEEQISDSLEKYNTMRACRELIEFINDLSTWYVRRSRERIKSGDEDAKVAIATLGYVLVETSKLLAPFAPFFSDFLFKDLTGEESVHLTEWPDHKHYKSDKRLITDMELARKVVELGLSLRKDSGKKVRQPLQTIQYKFLGDIKQLPEEVEHIIAEELNVKQVISVEEVVPHQTFLVRIDGQTTVAVDTHITPELEKEGIARELERQVQDLRKKSGLSVGDLVDLYYTTQDETLSHIMINLLDRKKTFVVNVATSLEVEPDFEIQSEIDNKPIWLGLVIKN